MIKIQFASDLHLERNLISEHFSKNPIEPVADILILAGDITEYKRIMYEDKFFDDVSKNFEQVWIIPGNHEYYNIHDLSLINKPFLNIKIRDNVTLLNNQNIVYKGINFIFSTLWTDVPVDKMLAVQIGMMDYFYIKKDDNIDSGYDLTVSDINKIHARDFAYVKKTVEENTEEKVFIVTHHAPTKAVIERYRLSEPLNAGFVTELHPFIWDNDIDYWLYGHTHKNIDFELNGTKIISNQFGDFNSDYENDKYVEL